MDTAGVQDAGMAATLDVSKGLTPHYYFNFGVYLQVVGERRSTKAEERVLHFDLNFGALKLLQKESLKLTIKLDIINQVIYDESEPRTVLISCHDDRRYLLDFQNAEENLVFRTAYAAVVDNSFDISRFNRSLLMKGPVAKRAISGFKERYLILVPRKLFILSTKTSIFPRSVLSLLDANPRYDEARGTVHLDVMGKEYVFRADSKEETMEWFVALASGCGLAPVFVEDEEQPAGPGADMPAYARPPSTAYPSPRHPMDSPGPQPRIPLPGFHHQQQQQQHRPHTPPRPQSPRTAHFHSSPGSIRGEQPNDYPHHQPTPSRGGSYRPTSGGSPATPNHEAYGNNGPYNRYGSGSDAASERTVSTGRPYPSHGAGILPAPGGRAGSVKTFKQQVLHHASSFRRVGSVPLPGMTSRNASSGMLPYGSSPGGAVRGMAAGSVAAWHATGSPSGGGGRAPSMQDGMSGEGMGYAGPVPLGSPLSRSPSVSPGRTARNGSMPGPLSLRAGLVRSGRNGSLPGPAHVPPQPTVDVPYRFEEVGAPASRSTSPGHANGLVRPTHATARGILREKSNTSPWMTDIVDTPPPPPYSPQHAMPYGHGPQDHAWESDASAEQQQAEYDRGYRDAMQRQSDPYGAANEDAYQQGYQDAEMDVHDAYHHQQGMPRGGSGGGGGRHHADNQPQQGRSPGGHGSRGGVGSGGGGGISSASSTTSSGSGRRNPSPLGARASNRPPSLPTVYERETDDREAHVTEEYSVQGGGAAYGREAGHGRRMTSPPRARPSPQQQPQQPSASPNTVTGSGGGGKYGSNDTAADVQGSAASPRAVASSVGQPAPDPFKLLNDIQARLRCLSAESHAASEAADLMNRLGGVNGIGMGNANGGNAVHGSAAAGAAQQQQQPQGVQAGDQYVAPSTGGRTAPVPWSAVPLPYHAPNTTGETITSQWLRDRTTSAWSTGTADYNAMADLAPPAPQQPHLQPGSAPTGPAATAFLATLADMAGPQQGTWGTAGARGTAVWRPPGASVMGGGGGRGPGGWRARAEVEDSPCLKPSVVNSHNKYLKSRTQGSADQQGAVNRLRSPSSATTTPSKTANGSTPPQPRRSVADATRDALTGHRKSMTLLAWTFSNYDSLLRDTRNMEPQVLLAAAEDAAGAAAGAAESDVEDGGWAQGRGRKSRAGPGVRGEDEGGGKEQQQQLWRRERIASAQMEWMKARAAQPALRWRPSRLHRRSELVGLAEEEEREREEQEEEEEEDRGRQERAGSKEVQMGTRAAAGREGSTAGPRKSAAGKERSGSRGGGDGAGVGLGWRSGREEVEEMDGVESEEEREQRGRGAARSRQQSSAPWRSERQQSHGRHGMHDHGDGGLEDYEDQGYNHRSQDQQQHTGRGQQQPLESEYSDVQAQGYSEADNPEHDQDHIEDGRYDEPAGRRPSHAAAPDCRAPGRHARSRSTSPNPPAPAAAQSTSQRHGRSHSAHPSSNPNGATRTVNGRSVAVPLPPARHDRSLSPARPRGASSAGAKEAQLRERDVERQWGGAEGGGRRRRESGSSTSSGGGGSRYEELLQRQHGKAGLRPPAGSVGGAGVPSRSAKAPSRAGPVPVQEGSYEDSHRDQERNAYQQQQQQRQHADRRPGRSVDNRNPRDAAADHRTSNSGASDLGSEYYSGDAAPVPAPVPRKGSRHTNADSASQQQRHPSLISHHADHHYDLNPSLPAYASAPLPPFPPSNPLPHTSTPPNPSDSIHHSRISLSDFATLAASTADPSSTFPTTPRASRPGSLATAAPNPQPHHDPHSSPAPSHTPAATYTTPVQAPGTTRASSPPSADGSAIIEMQQDISSLMPGMSLVLRVKRPAANQPTSLPSTRGTNTLSQGGAPPSPRSGSEHGLTPQSHTRLGSTAGGAASEDGAFAFRAVPAPPGTPSRQQAGRYGSPPPARGSMGGSSVGGSVGGAIGPGVGLAPGSPMQLGQLSRMLQEHLYGRGSVSNVHDSPRSDRQGSGTGHVRAVGVSVAGVQSPRSNQGPASAAGAAAARPVPAGYGYADTYRPIDNPLFQASPSSHAQLDGYSGEADSDGYADINGQHSATDNGRTSGRNSAREYGAAGMGMSSYVAAAAVATAAAAAADAAAAARQAGSVAYGAGGGATAADDQGDLAALLAALQAAGLTLPMDAATAAAVLSNVSPRSPRSPSPGPSPAPAPASPRRPSIARISPESSRCIQHAAMVAAEAASSAVTEAMSALSRMRFTSTTHNDRPSSGGSGYGYPGSVGGGVSGGVDAGTAAATLSALGCGMGNAELAALAGALQSSVGVEMGMGMGTSGGVVAAEAGRGDQAVLVGSFIDRLARRDSARGAADGAEGAAVGLGGEAGVADRGEGQTRAYRGSSLQSMLQLVNAGALTSDEFLANLAKGGLRSVLRQQQS